MLFIELPKSIADAVQRSFREVVALFERDAPSAVFILERSAVLPAQKHIQYIRENYPTVPILYLPIGQIMPMVFMDEEAFNLDVGVDLLRTHAQLYQTWLQDTDHPYIKHLRQQIVTGLVDCDHKSILVIDDAMSIGEHSGETLEVSVPLLIQAAMGKEIETIPHTIFGNALSGWDRDIVQSWEMGLSKAEECFVHEYIKGSLDLRMIAEDYFGEDACVKETIGRRIKHANQCGEYIIEHTDDDFHLFLDANAIYWTQLFAPDAIVESPFAALTNRFGEATIRTLPENVRALFGNL